MRTSVALKNVPSCSTVSAKRLQRNQFEGVVLHEARASAELSLEVDKFTPHLSHISPNLGRNQGKQIPALCLNMVPSGRNYALVMGV